MPQLIAIGRDGYVKPTEAQIRSNIMVVPKAFINQHAQRLAWHAGFDLLIGDERIANRRLDSENRIGGIPLRNYFRFGQLLRLEVIDSTTLRLRGADETELPTTARA